MFFSKILGKLRLNKKHFGILVVLYPNRQTFLMNNNRKIAYLKKINFLYMFINSNFKK